MRDFVLILKLGNCISSHPLHSSLIPCCESGTNLSVCNNLSNSIHACRPEHAVNAASAAAATARAQRSQQAGRRLRQQPAHHALSSADGGRFRNVRGQATGGVLRGRCCNFSGRAQAVGWRCCQTPGAFLPPGVPLGSTPMLLTRLLMRVH